MEQTSKKQAATTIAVVAITIFLVLGIIVLAKKKSHKNLGTATTDSANQTQATNSTSVDTNAPQTTTTDTSGDYQDGTYKATGTYTSPGGNESITINVTLKDGVVTATEAESGANDPTAKQYQAEFIAGYKDQVVGKKITSIKLSRVSGSSLTSQGFNSAIQQIKQQAQV